eukprot:6492059-Amphidinium_carterae.2
MGSVTVNGPGQRDSDVWGGVRCGFPPGVGLTLRKTVRCVARIELATDVKVGQLGCELHGCVTLQAAQKALTRGSQGHALYQQPGLTLAIPKQLNMSNGTLLHVEDRRCRKRNESMVLVEFQNDFGLHRCNDDTAQCEIKNVF